MQRGQCRSSWLRLCRDRFVMMSLMIEANNTAPATSKPTFSIGQMMFLIAWLGLVFGLLRASASTPPREFGRCQEIAVSNSGKHAAAAYSDDIRLFRNGSFVDKLEVGRVDSLRFIDDETLVIVSLDGTLPRGVHFHSVDQRKITRSLSLSANLTARVRLLDDKYIVHEIDKNLDGQFHVYDMNSESSTPVSSHPSPRTNMPFDATNDCRYVAFHLASIREGDFDFWDSRRGPFCCDLKAEESSSSLKISNGLAFSPDGSYVITSRNEITKIKWPSAEKIWSFAVEEPCGRVRISRGNDKFAVLTGEDYSDQERYLRVYGTDSAEKLFELNLNEDFGTAYSFSGDGKSIWAASQDERGVLTQWDIASGSKVNQSGSASRIQSTALYALLFLLWSVAYVRLFPSRLLMPLKRGLSVFMSLNSLFLLAMGCYFVFQSSSSTIVKSGFVTLTSGNIILVLALRSMIASVSKKSDTDIA